MIDDDEPIFEEMDGPFTVPKSFLVSERMDADLAAIVSRYKVKESAVLRRLIGVAIKAHKRQLARAEAQARRDAVETPSTVDRPREPAYSAPSTPPKRQR